VSTGVGCGDPNTPAIYGFVAPQVAWIQATYNAGSVAAPQFITFVAAALFTLFVFWV